MRFYFPPADLYAVIPLEFLLRGEFNTDDAAPITTPLTLSPGPGVITSVQTDGTLDIADGSLDFTAQATPVWGDQGFYGSAVSRAAGVMLVAQFVFTTWEECGFGWHTAAAVANANAAKYLISLNTTNGQLDDRANAGSAGEIREALTTANEFYFIFILRGTGCFYVLKNGDDFELFYHINTGAEASLYPMFTNYDGAGKIGTLRTAQLAAPWDTDKGVFDNDLALPGAGTAFTHEADFTMQFTVDAMPTTQILVDFRITDASNYFQCWINAAGTFRLYEFVAGGSNMRANSAPPVAITDVIKIRCFGSKIQMYVNDQRYVDYTSANNQTATGGEVSQLGGASAISNFFTFPWYLSGDAKTTIETYLQNLDPLSVGADLVQDLIGYYDFEGALGADETDQHGNAEDMVQTNSPPSVAGIISTGRDAIEGGTNKYFTIATPHSFAFAGSFTITGWHNTTTQTSGVGKYHNIFHTDTWNLMRTFNNAIAFIIDDATVHGTVTLGAWEFFAATHNSATKTIEIWIGDAGGLNKDGTDVYTGAYSAPAADIVIGTATNLAASQISFDTFAIFDKTLTQEQIEWIYNAGAGRPYADYG